MNLADKPIYPTTEDNSLSYPPSEGGITYKQWLVGMLAGNAQIIENAWDDDGMPTMNTADDALVRNAKSVIRQADAIIKQLEEE